MHDPGKVEAIVSRTRKDPIFLLSCKWDEEGSCGAPIRWQKGEVEETAESTQEFFLHFSSAGDFFSPKKTGVRRFYRMVVRGLLKTVVPDVELFFFIFFFFLRLVAEKVLHHLMPLLFPAHLALSLSDALARLSLSLARLSLSLALSCSLCPKPAFCFPPEPRIENGRCSGRESAPPVVKARSVKDCGGAATLAPFVQCACPSSGLSKILMMRTYVAHSLVWIIRRSRFQQLRHHLDL